MKDYIQFYDKEIEYMTLWELKNELTVHNWHANKMEECLKANERRLKWLQEHKPLVDISEYREQWENGEITKSQFLSVCGTKRRALIEHTRTEARISYAASIIAHERAIVNYINERQEELKVRPRPGKSGRRYVNPRKPAGPDNPKEDWLRTHPRVRKPRSLKNKTERWQILQDANRRVKTVKKRSVAIENWNLDKLRTIAKSRGYYTDTTLFAAVADEFKITVSGAKRLLQSGQLTWGQTVVLGAFLEMTPAEFCDTFLAGYFKEVVDGKWIAYVENKDELLGEPLVFKQSNDNLEAWREQQRAEKGEEEW